MVSDGHIDEDTKWYLTPKEPRTARFYHLPKIHKPDIPGRPIVSSCGAPTKRISKFVDHHLKPFVALTRSCIKDTTDFLQKLNGMEELPSGCILVTLDVHNIPHDEGLRRALDKRSCRVPPTTYLIRMMELILTFNNFSFNNKQYLQLHRTAMGTQMAPSYANLFMADLEQ